ncbi:ATP-dependent zinc metalloprotease [Quillaja saponaria]|uniref:ATP-dependent zinc metalloprotease n=1 Tax=Quillaja saponaria TaxID=32244 RepID=A0AAD7L0I1_QUISA|nr:ATP-dependent zinc metalloprotease [Quillaja saponaria]
MVFHGELSIPKHYHQHQTVTRALREWREYEDAVKRKDLAGALRFLKSMENENPIEAFGGSSPFEAARSRFVELGLFGPQRDWDVLDTCLNADDMKLVGNAYKFLRDRGFLPNFGKCRNIVLEGPRNVTPNVLKSSTGLEVSKLSPKKWGLSGSSSTVLVAFLGGTSYLLSQGIDIRTNLAVILGHLLTAYLMGCPIRGVILDPIVAMQMGIQGQAGTQFWDEKMANDLAEGRLDGTAFDRYCMVLFSGIAAEALVYGEAEGGENDENLFRGICPSSATSIICS